MGPVEPGMGPLNLKLTLADRGIDPPDRENSLFSGDVDKEMLQVSIDRSKNGPTGTERR